MIYPSLQRMVYEILDEKIDESFKVPLLRIKTEELICRLLMELEKREETQLYWTQLIYKPYIRFRIRLLTHLDTPPLIKDLAMKANMSITK